MMIRSERSMVRGGLMTLLFLLLAVGMSAQLIVLPAAAQEAETAGFSYQHDPRLNPKAMEDIEVDPTAIYGFSPNAAGSLKDYRTSFDWSDPEAVARGRQERLAYHESFQSMYEMLLDMKAEGKSTEEIARAVSAERNVIRIASYDGDPEGLAVMKARNLEKYGREEGPTPDEMYEKYGSWEAVIEKAFSVNMGMDACLGLYDDYYPIYLALDQIPDEADQTATREYAVSAFVRAIGKERFPEGSSALDAFSDGGTVTPWFRDEVSAAVEGGMLRGYEDGTLRSGSSIRRVEALVILSRCLPDLELVREPIPFTDLPEWAKGELDRLSAAGLVVGYGGGVLGADDLLTVEQVGILTARLAERQAG